MSGGLTLDFPDGGLHEIVGVNRNYLSEDYLASLDSKTMSANNDFSSEVLELQTLVRNECNSGAAAHNYSVPGQSSTQSF